MTNNSDGNDGSSSTRVASQVLAEVAAWHEYRQAGDAKLAPGSPTTAIREARTLKILAAAYDPPLASLSQLMVAGRARPGLDRLRARLLESSNREAAMAYQAARLLYRIGNSGFPESQGWCVSKPEVQALDRLGRRYSPKGWKDVSFRLGDVLRPFCNAELGARLLHLPEELFLSLPDGKLKEAQKRILTKAYALQLALEIPEKPGWLTSIVRNQMRIVDSERIVVYARPDTTAPKHILGDLSPIAISLHRSYCERVLEVGDPRLFPGRGSGSLAPNWLREQLKALTKEALGVELSFSQLRWVVAFIHLARDPGAADLIRGYLGHQGDRALEPLLKLVEDWRRSGALDSYCR